MKNRFILPSSLLAAGILSLNNASAQTAPPPPPPPPPPPNAAAPLPGLTPAQQMAFAAGRLDFEKPETAASGLGPIFNDVSCVACHSQAGTGGSSNRSVTRFGKVTNGVFDPLAAIGGSLLQQRAIAPEAREVVPLSANLVALRQTTPLWGMGLIEAIPDATILQSVNQVKPDAVRGRAAMVLDVASGQMRVGKFGWKAQQATLLAFTGDAFVNEMGITNELFPRENAPNGNAARLAQFDRVADPEDRTDPVSHTSDVTRVADFMRFLAPLPPRPQTTLAAGRALFTQVGCVVCHTPVLTTGPNAVAALSNKPVPLYSDLLLHYMGVLNDGVAQAGANANEMKTQPLWGLRASAPYLHDGRAQTVDAAILGHGGEALPAKGRYVQLTAVAKQQLLDFLNSL